MGRTGSAGGSSSGRVASVAAVIQQAASTHSDQVALVDGSFRATYGELMDHVRGFGAALVASDVQAGDRVAIWAANGAAWVVAALGTWYVGAVLVPVNTRFKGTEAAQVLSRSGAKVLVTMTDFLGVDYLAMLDGTAPDLTGSMTTVVAGGPVPGGAVAWNDFVDRAGDDHGRAVQRRAAAVTAKDPADILFTSGTTGVPKGVVQTQASTLCVATDWVAMTGLHSGDRYLMVNPYFHMFGLKAGILASVVAGATMLPEPVLDVDRLLDRVERERITVLPGPPTLYQSVLDHPGVARRDLSSLRVAVTGAADIPVELVRRVRAELPFSVLVSGYGLTEGGTAASTGPEDGPEAVATTVGRPRPGYQVRIVDEQLAEVGAGQVGQILLTGGGVMREYLDDPDATAEAFTTDGWLRTGDLGLIDAEGRLQVVGRSKDMFIVGGFNVYPAEVENFLLGYPEVAEVAVVGAPDRRLGEVGVAFVVPRAGRTVDPDALVAWARQQMANFKVPRVVQVVEALPLTASGKVHKEALRRQAADQGDGRAS